MFDPKTVKDLKRVEEREAVHLSEAVVVDEIRSVSVDQSVEGKAVLPAVGEKRRVRGEGGGDAHTFAALQVNIIGAVNKNCPDLPPGPRSTSPL